MNISDHLQRAASDADGLDLDHLARVARVQGTRHRRRRRGLAVLGTAALVGAVAVGSSALLGHGSDPAGRLQVADSGTPEPSASAPTPTPTLHPSDTGRFTGRGVAAGLRQAVSDVEQGRAGAFAGQAGTEAYGQLDWTDADGLGVSVVGLNVQPGMDYVSPCGRYELRCTRSHPTPGSTLVTYEEHSTVAGGVGIRRVADLLRADGTRVVVGATNGYELPSNRWDITRAQPPLSFAQLTRIVDRPWWGEELPRHLLDQGNGLTPYDELGQSWAGPTPGAQPSGGPGAQPSGG
ncbi:MAG: hypothetical protein ABI776_02715 [Nocardioidaceae bacterium]